MARNRMIKPELWTDPEFVECSPNARLLFVAALNFASDYGVLPDKPVQLKMQCFPGDAIDVVPLIDELVQARLWLRVIAPDGENVLVVRTFNRHQRVDKPNKGKWGNPDDWDEFVERSSNDRGTVVDLSSLKEVKEVKEESSAEQSSNDHGFGDFWAAYPRKLGRAKAATAWRRLKAAEREEALKALPRHTAAWKDPQFIPHASTWLNGRRWEDDLGERPRNPREGSW